MSWCVVHTNLVKEKLKFQRPIHASLLVHAQGNLSPTDRLVWLETRAYYSLIQVLSGKGVRYFSRFVVVIIERSTWVGSTLLMVSRCRSRRWKGGLYWFVPFRIYNPRFSVGLTIGLDGDEHKFFSIPQVYSNDCFVDWTDPVRENKWACESIPHSKQWTQDALWVGV